MTHTYKDKRVKLHGVFQYAGVIEPSMLVGGHTGGQVAYPVAIVEFENGDIEQVLPYQIKGFASGSDFTKPTPIEIAAMNIYDEYHHGSKEDCDTAVINLILVMESVGSDEE